MSNGERNLSEVSDLNGSAKQDKPRTEWVKFDDDSTQAISLPKTEAIPNSNSVSVVGTSKNLNETLPAVLKTETVHVNIERSDKTEPASQVTLNKSIEFVNVRQGFCK